MVNSDVIVLSNGVKMPRMAIGTNWMKYKELKSVMESGFDAGFRAIDTARDYGNESVVGKVLYELTNESRGGEYKREDIFLTTKIGNGQQIKGDICKEIDISLKTDYVDLWLMHWPYPGYYERTWEKMMYMNQVRYGLSVSQILMCGILGNLFLLV